MEERKYEAVYHEKNDDGGDDLANECTI